MSLPTLYEKNIFEKNSFLYIFILIMRFDSYDIVTTKGLKMEIIHERAKLRLMDNTDVETLFSIVEGNRDIWAYLISKMDSVQDMQQYVQKAIKGYGRGTQIPFIVVDQQSNKIVGSTRLYNISVEDKTVELGQTWYHPSVQRTSINTECKYMLLQYAFENCIC